MKKLISLLMSLILILGCAQLCFASGTGYHTESSYLDDTLTLAGSGFDGVRELTVRAVEALYSDPDIGYENIYSTMTSGSVFSKHTFTGVRLYELLINEGMKKDLPDTTSVKLISKDGYTINLTLGDIRTGRNRYASKGGDMEEQGLPALVAFASNSVPLVGPTGTESVYKRFDEQDGYDESAENIGGPLRLILGQTSSYEFNAPMCAKWLSAIVVGDDNGYVYSRKTDAEADNTEPDRTGDWTHAGKEPDFTLKISGSEAKGTVYLSLSELESMTEGTVREYYAASAGRNAYEGVTLKYLVMSFLGEDISQPTSVTVKAPDGYTKKVDVKTLLEGVDSFYQPGKHRDVLLAWAVDGAPLVENESSEGYNGKNGNGPLRLVVENTISMWVKSVSEIVIGDETGYTDVTESRREYKEIMDVTGKGIMQGVGEGRFDPDGEVTRAQLVTMLWRLAGEKQAKAAAFSDVPGGTWYSDAVNWAAENGIVTGYGDGTFRPNAVITREQLAAVIFRYACANGLDAVTLEDNLGFEDAESISEYAASAMNWCAGRGYIEGADGLIRPGDALKRGEAAVCLSRFSTDWSGR